MRKPKLFFLKDGPREEDFRLFEFTINLVFSLGVSLLTAYLVASNNNPEGKSSIGLPPHCGLFLYESILSGFAGLFSKLNGLGIVDSLLGTSGKIVFGLPAILVL